MWGKITEPPFEITHKFIFVLITYLVMWLWSLRIPSQELQQCPFYCSVVVMALSRYHHWLLAETNCGRSGFWTPRRCQSQMGPLHCHCPQVWASWEPQKHRILWGVFWLPAEPCRWSPPIWWSKSAFCWRILLRILNWPHLPCGYTFYRI